MCLNNNPDHKVAYSPFKFQDPDELQVIKSGINKHVSPLVNYYRKIEETKVDVSAKRKFNLNFNMTALRILALMASVTSASISKEPSKGILTLSKYFACADYGAFSRIISGKKTLLFYVCFNIYSSLTSGWLRSRLWRSGI